MQVEDNLSDIKILSIEGSKPDQTWSRNTLINHLAAARDDSEEEKMTEIHEIEIEGVLYRRKNLMEDNNTTEVEVKALDFVLESARALEQENFGLKERLKYEKEKHDNEAEEKSAMKKQMMLQQKLLKRLEKRAENLQTEKKKSVVQQFQCFDDGLEECSQLGEEAFTKYFDEKDTLEMNENDNFHGFFDEEIVRAVSSARKQLLDKLVVDEQAGMDLIESEIEETWKRSLLEKLIEEEELDSSREWLDVDGIFDDI
eukprot:GFUD01036510.1.p1 GENE.GFUD01036510.1~~GFUD01036510.1.p1  ORF type:complete len:257 (-),score=90.28 GFUD01036510.1:106-876(-)